MGRQGRGRKTRMVRMCWRLMALLQDALSAFPTSNRGLKPLIAFCNILNTKCKRLMEGCTCNQDDGIAVQRLSVKY